MERKEDEQLPECQYGPDQPPPLPPATLRPVSVRGQRQPAPAPDRAALSGLRLMATFTALLLAIIAELALGSVDVSNDGIGRLLQIAWVGPVLLLAWLALMISVPVLLHWLLTRIETTLSSWIFWALLVAVAISVHVVYAHGGLWSQLRT